VSVQRAADSQAAAVKDVGIDYHRLHIFVTEEFLHCSYIVSVFEQMGGEAVPAARCVSTDVLVHPGSASGRPDRLLQTTFSM
jgi:hypothetical protein